MMAHHQAIATRLSREDRQEQILAILKLEGAVRIAALAEAFGVTTETARRDLDQLARQGLVLRTYGGATGQRSLIDEPDIAARRQVRIVERGRIAEHAAGLVAAGDALMIDCGSTTALFAQALARRNLHLTVITNCLSVVTILGSSAKSRVVVCPGDYVAREGGVYGFETVEFIRRFQADKAFIGAGGLTPEGITDADSQGSWVKRAMIERSTRTVLIMDSSKFAVPQFERVTGLQEIDDLVCETAIPRDLMSPLQDAHVQVHIAKAAPRADDG
jgi:DeoR family transcriptional regulator, glycerol-3-phosphate regulon repressor